MLYANLQDNRLSSHGTFKNAGSTNITLLVRGRLVMCAEAHA